MVSWSRVARRIRVPLGFVFAALYIWLARPNWASIAAGGVMAVMGAALRALASGHVKKNTELTTTGPYAYSRNPLYVGSMIMGAGFAVASLSWWVVVGLVVLFAAIYIPVIGSEEAFLRGQFPEFDDYSRRVPRFVGLVRNHANKQRSAFSRELYWKHREYNAAIGTVAMLAALAIKVWLRRP